MNKEFELIELLKQVLSALETKNKEPEPECGDTFLARAKYERLVDAALIEYKEAHVENMAQLRTKEEQLTSEYTIATELYRRAEQEANDNYVKTVTKLRNAYYKKQV